MDAITDGSGVVLDDQTVERPYGWVFFYQSRAYLKTRQPTLALRGNAPVIFNRISGEYHVTGTAEPLEHYIAEYESTLSPIQLRGASAAPDALGTAKWRRT